MHSRSPAYGGGKAKEKINRVPSAPQMVLNLPEGHEGSEHVLSFEIGQQEGGFYSARTHRHTEPPSRALVHRLYYV